MQQHKAQSVPHRPWIALAYLLATGCAVRWSKRLPPPPTKRARVYKGPLPPLYSVACFRGREGLPMRAKLRFYEGPAGQLFYVVPQCSVVGGRRRLPWNPSAMFAMLFSVHCCYTTTLAPLDGTAWEDYSRCSTTHTTRSKADRPGICFCKSHREDVVRP